MVIVSREALFLGVIPSNGVEAPDHSGVVDEAVRELHSQSRRRDGDRVCADRQFDRYVYHRRSPGCRHESERRFQRSRQFAKIARNQRSDGGWALD